MRVWSPSHQECELRQVSEPVPNFLFEGAISLLRDERDVLSGEGDSWPVQRLCEPQRLGGHAAREVRESLRPE